MPLQTKIKFYLQYLPPQKLEYTRDIKEEPS